MTSDQPVAIDDGGSALALMSQLGQKVMQPVVALVREAVMLYAARAGWKIVSHSTFVHWAARQIDKDYLWLVLDPLIDPEGLPANALRLRLTRRPDADWRFDDEVPPDVKSSFSGKQIGILDDAAASGDTLTFLADSIAHEGGELSDVILCVATDRARSAVSRVAPGAAWVQMYKTPATPIHIRDACPLLPYSGRRLSRLRAITVGQVQLLTAVPPVFFTGGLWHRLSQDRAASSTLRLAWLKAAERYSDFLQRPALVSDIPALGAEIPVPLFFRTDADPTTELSDLLVHQ
jgi:hypothetical protein